MILIYFIFGPRQANLLLIAYASSEGSGEPAHPRSLARTSAARSYKQWVKRNLQTESQIHSPSEWLGMRSWNLSWRNARRHKFAWRGPFYMCICRSATLINKYSVLFYEHNDPLKKATYKLSRIATKPTKWHVRPAKTQISLGIRPIWSESSLSAWRKQGSLATH